MHRPPAGWTNHSDGVRATTLIASAPCSVPTSGNNPAVRAVVAEPTPPARRARAAKPTAAQGSSRPQASDQLALQSPTADVERLIERLIIAELHLELVGQMLRGSKPSPTAISPTVTVAAVPGRPWPRHRPTVGSADHPGQTVLHAFALLVSATGLASARGPPADRDAIARPLPTKPRSAAGHPVAAQREIVDGDRSRCRAVVHPGHAHPRRAICAEPVAVRAPQCADPRRARLFGGRGDRSWCCRGRQWDASVHSCSGVVADATTASAD